MADSTPNRLRNTLIYQVYTRNHTVEGTFNALKDDLPRIKSLGTDIVYLLPINSIGKKQRKGTLGSPYAIKDYYAINEELGTLEDFKSLIKAIHQEGMRVMLDIVFNHTSPDSKLLHSHPHYFYKENGQFTNRIGDWWDIVDFDFTSDNTLYDTLTNVLLYYADLGVDGFRFDVASLLPKDFLTYAKDRVTKKHPDIIWLSESVHGHFLREVRNRGFDALSESEIFEIFDMAYDYDAHPFFEDYIHGKRPLDDYVFWLNRQEEIYPKNYVKLRNLENHDFGRIAGRLQNDAYLLKNWHAFTFFQKGATLIFSGSEASCTHHPDLFNKDTIDFSGPDISQFLSRLKTITTGPLFTEGVYDVDKVKGHDVIKAAYSLNEHQVRGYFNVTKDSANVAVDLADGPHTNQITQTVIHVENGTVKTIDMPLIIRVK